MREEFRIAWRNLWRNRRRTLITSSSVFFAVFFAVTMRSYQLGSYDHMITGFIESFTGYIQVQHNKFQDNPLIDNSFKYNDSLAGAIMNIKNVVSVSPHIESFTLASNGTQTKGVAIMAIDPLIEKKISNPENKLVKFRITDRTIQALKESGKLTDVVIHKVSKNLGRSYSSIARMRMELGLSTDEDKLFLPDIQESSRVSNGYFTDNDNGILVSDRLSRYLKVAVGDSVILIGQGYHGISATGIFPVRGIIKMPSPEIDNKLIVMTLQTAQIFFDADCNVTSMVVNLTGKSERTIRNVQAGINSLLPDKNTKARTWFELNPILYQQIQGDSQTGMAMLGLLYFIIFFGIFGTVLMMVSERKKEFGVLVAIGMQKNKLKRVITIEMFMLGAIGLICGLLASAPLIVYFYYYPILLKGNLGSMMEDYGWDPVMPAAWFGPYYFWQAGIVALMVLLATIYPLRKINSLKESDALKN